MSSIADQLAARAEAFADRVLAFARGLQHEPLLEEILKQVIDSSSSEAVNYSATRHARSRKEFVAKMGLVVEEADESERWLKRLTVAAVTRTAKDAAELAWLQDESTQLRAIFVKSYATAKENYERMVAEEKAAKANRRAKRLPSSGRKPFDRDVDP